jgi:hypothetical protein
VNQCTLPVGPITIKISLVSKFVYIEYLLPSGHIRMPCPSLIPCFQSPWYRHPFSNCKSGSLYLSS